MAKIINLHGHNYEVISATTQRARRIYDSFCDSSDTDLSDVYGRYSQAKVNAYRYCRDRERECGSYNGVIASHCIMQFTYAFTTWQDGKKYLVYITKDHDYVICLDDMELRRVMA